MDPNQLQRTCLSALETRLPPDDGATSSEGQACQAEPPATHLSTQQRLVGLTCGCWCGFSCHRGYTRPTCCQHGYANVGCRCARKRMRWTTECTGIRGACIAPDCGMQMYKAWLDTPGTHSHRRNTIAWRLVSHTGQGQSQHGTAALSGVYVCACLPGLSWLCRRGSASHTSRLRCRWLSPDFPKRTSGWVKSAVRAHAEAAQGARDGARPGCSTPASSPTS